ncbi:MAG TPA: ABC transporter permease subunit [Isosphaeraceae bacterium]|jgi:ABC-type dipeptide/oligopeptide/nickel transport system permease component|nr:ABC transporter permease subunit [Isosphaeraceae bacterium]
MNGLKRFLKSLIVLVMFGASAVTLTFYIVSQTDELADERLRLSSERAPAPELFGPRYLRWVRTVFGSGLTDFGQSHTGPVKNVLADRLPVTAAIGFLSWTFGWGLGLLLAILLGTRWRRHATLHQERIYPIAHAVPSLVVVILFYLILVQIDPRPSRLLRTSVGILSLTVLLLPSATALWLNGILRILDREYVRVARARGISSFALWSRHIMPNVVVSSGVLTQAVFSLGGLMVGSAFVEGVFRLGGVGEAFIEGATRGQAELAGFATLVYFLVTAVGVLLAEGMVIYLDPDGELSRES